MTSNEADHGDTEEASTDVLFDVTDGVARIRLNRPRAINALNHDMVQQISARLGAWADDEDIRTVVLTGEGDRGLCAGGDIVAIYHEAREGTGVDGRSAHFWRDEYRLNAAIHDFPKPFVAVMDGIVMGGGVGLAGHAGTRVVTERTMIAMPEVGIGFVPDVGGTWLLARAPGGLGTHLGLTAGRMNGADAIATGFADHYLDSEDLEEFIDAIVMADLDTALGTYVQDPPASELVNAREWVDAAYAGEDVQQIVERLQQSSSPEARSAAESLLAKSPTSVTVTLRALRAAAGSPSLHETLNAEFRTSVHSLATADLVEGIRAQVVDKDRNPRWSPPTLAEVTPDAVDAYFAPLGERELGLSAPAAEGVPS